MKTNEPSRCVLAVDVGGTFIKSALLTLSGTMLPGSPDEVRVDSNGTAHEIEQSFRRVAQRMAAQAAALGVAIAGVGVSTPGPFDYAGGRYMMDHKYRAVKGLPVRPWFTGVLGDVPVEFVHDSTAYILGLMTDPAINRYDRVSAVMLGTGLGFALSVDGAILKNPQGGPGVSLFKIPYREGIAEDYVSRRGIIARYKKASGRDDALDVVDIAGLARQGDAAALQTFRDTGTMLGEITAPVLSEYRVECLVVGGQIARSYDLFETPLTQTLQGVPSLREIRPVGDFTGTPIRGAYAHLLTFIDE